ncbi:MAG: hypothetical protein H6Q14_557 [Bacteroidetes bacterium]|nr:hypothetical protein [Bacteroidota bacterium]
MLILFWTISFIIAIGFELSNLYILPFFRRKYSSVEKNQILALIILEE